MSALIGGIASIPGWRMALGQLPQYEQQGTSGTLNDQPPSQNSAAQRTLGAAQTPASGDHADNHAADADRRPITVTVDLEVSWSTIISNIVIGSATIVLAVFAVLQWRIYRLMRHDSIARDRAFVFAHETRAFPNIDSKGQVVAWMYYTTWQNGGITPAQRVIMHTSVHIKDGIAALSEEFEFRDEWDPNEPAPSITYVGPKGSVDDGPKVIWLPDLIAIMKRQKRGFIYGWIEYDDVFLCTQRHRTEFCLEIGVYSDPSIFEPGPMPTAIFIFNHYGPHNGADEERHRSIVDFHQRLNELRKSRSDAMQLMPDMLY